MKLVIENFLNLASCLERCANFNDSYNSDYAYGKAVAFRFAAEWLRRECEFMSRMEVVEDEKKSR